MLSSTDKGNSQSKTLGIVRDISDVEKRQDINIRGDADSGPKAGSSDKNMHILTSSQNLASSIQSTNTSLGSNVLLEITKPTFVPNNTPVESPLSSPHLDHPTTKNTQVESNNKKGSTTGDKYVENPQISSSTLPVLSPPSNQFPNRLRDVFHNDDNGGCLPPKPEKVAARVGEQDHVVQHTHQSTGLIKSRDGSISGNSSQLDNDNSPIAIINRRNFFNTSDSRSSGSLQAGGGLSPSLRANTKHEKEMYDGTEKNTQSDEAHSELNMLHHSERRSSSQDCGIAPTVFYFDKDRSITDPYVKHEQSHEKIKISSWLNSKQNSEIYSLIDSGDNGENRGTKNNFQEINLTEGSSSKLKTDVSNKSTDRDTSRGEYLASSQSKRPDSSDGFISPQPPKSALSMSSSIGGGDIELPYSMDSMNSSGRFGDTEIDGEDEKFVPPPPPRFINSKLDGLRTRLLVNPRGQNNKYEEDIGTATAAAVLSNMKSTPFRFSERSPQVPNSSNTSNIYNTGNNSSGSRPGSSSFSTLKNYPRPIIRVHQRESPLEDADENAILDDDEEDDNEKRMESEDDNEKAGLKNNTNQKRDNDKNLMNSSHQTKKQRLNTNAKEEEVTKEVTWNKSGRRVTARKPIETTGRRRKPRNKPIKGKDSRTDSSASDIGREDDEKDSLKEDDEDEEYAVETKNNVLNRKGSMGSRSRTGCWICRLRKKKCTEERPHCYNCERLNLECNYGNVKPDFVLDPIKKQLKLDEIKKKTKEAKRNAMRKKPFR